VSLALLIVNAISYARGAIAQGSCAVGDQSYIVHPGDTLFGIANAKHTTWQDLASYNHLARPSLIMPGQIICIPGSVSMTSNLTPTTYLTNFSAIVGTIPAPDPDNPFPYGQCTWWANERYHQLHGVYVPWWTIPANAEDWPADALKFGWHVSNTPQVGDIIALQPDVQLASSLGHVAVVEQVLSNGDVIASSMNWGLTLDEQSVVSTREFSPGPGVTFIHQ
jgi:surface antigen